MKNHINVSYVASKDELHKHSSLVIPKPTANMTGTYSCDVGSYASEDRRSSKLNIIFPEKMFYVKVSEDADNHKVECLAKGIFPEPKLTIL